MLARSKEKLDGQGYAERGREERMGKEEEQG